MRLDFRKYLTTAAMALVIGFAVPQAHARDDEDAQADRLAHALEVQGEKLAAEERALKAHEKKLAAEALEFNALKAKIEKLTGKKVHVAQAAASAQSPASNGDVPQEVGTDRKPVQPDRPPEVAKYIEEGGVLLPKGKLMITPGVEYDHSGAVNVAIEGFSIIPALNIGAFEITKVSQDAITASLDARLGVLNRLELEAKVPYLYSTQSSLGRPIGVGASNDTLTNVNGSGIGDVELGAHYQLNKGQDDWPYFVANLRYKFSNGTGPFEIPVDHFGQATQLPTGSGFDAIQPSVTAIYASDPVVFYANLGYTHSFEKSFPNFGTIQPGDAINGSFGMSTSINDATSLSLGYSHSMVFNTTENGKGLPGSQYLQVGSVDIGAAYTLNSRVSLDLNASIGVTDDAPSDRVILRVPVAFDVF